ncbi:RDD family protein [Bacillus massiliigorillae]|uniref:RDD family protein n=1 Tax=Bacillus massiliigorillae TaxID=1243664 RepID=UPI0003A0DDA1|nr:RDD family protein [Bacillus massiliigorillae]
MTQNQSNNQESVTYASFGRRLAAYLIDGMILSAIISTLAALGILSLIGVNLDLSQLQDPSYSLANNKGYLFATFIVGTLYYTLLQSSKWQATIGKKLLGVKVVTLEGDRISFFRAIIRHLVMFSISSLFYFGFIMALFTKRKQTLHDLLAKTLVIKETK